VYQNKYAKSGLRIVVEPAFDLKLKLKGIAAGVGAEAE
jgi:hypothetical protein